MNHHQTKTASLTAIAAGLLGAEATVRGVNQFGKARNANLLSAGITLGQKGERMHPYTETVSRNLLGTKQMQPYEAGKQIGARMQKMEPEKQERFLGKVVGMGSARKDRLLKETGKDPKSPVLNALESYQQGKDRHHPLFQKVITRHSKPDNGTTPKLTTLAASASTLPASIIDSRYALRPMLRTVEKQPVVSNTQKKLFPQDTKRAKAYQLVRDYID